MVSSPAGPPKQAVLEFDAPENNGTCEPSREISATTQALAQGSSASSATALDGLSTACADACLSRSTPMRLIRQQKTLLKGLSEDLAQVPSAAPDKTELFNQLQQAQEELKHWEAVVSEQYLPAHSAKQLLSPQALLVSPLFNVRGKATPRQLMHKVELLRMGKFTIQYQGPELRQSDGLVFMALLNLARDYRVGAEVQFEAGSVCRALYGYYDGRARGQLKEGIKRLMGAVLTFPDFSVQLALRFNHPSKGPWSVSLDPDIVKLFERSSQVWMDLHLRQALPEGLSTWLYGYVRSQPRLKPVMTAELRSQCGSDAKDDATFQRQLNRALNELVARNVVADSWAIKAGLLHWEKADKESALTEVSAAV